MTEIRFRRLTPTAIPPRRATPDAAGLDMCADLLDETGAARILKGSQGSLPVTPADGDGPARILLPPGERVLVPTGIAMALGPGLYARVAPRSGLALKDGVDILAGVIDRDYRGDCSAMVINTDPRKPVVIEHGQRIAQIVIERISLEDPVEDVGLEDTDRGVSGFGSTGK